MFYLCAKNRTVGLANAFQAKETNFLLFLNNFINSISYFKAKEHNSSLQTSLISSSTKIQFLTVRKPPASLVPN
jgi:hypothetical protein